MSRLTIDITEKQHQSLKALAALQGKTIKQYTLERLFPTGQGSDEHWSELEALLRERITEGITGHVSPHSIDAIVEDELNRDSSN